MQNMQYLEHAKIYIIWNGDKLWKIYLKICNILKYEKIYGGKYAKKYAGKYAGNMSESMLKIHEVCGKLWGMICGKCAGKYAEKLWKIC